MSVAAPSLYEQMFATAKASKLAQRTLGAMRLTRSFLLLEDDYDVDWEVDLDGHEAHIHPHRAPLRGPGRRSPQIGERRPGAVAPAPQHCLTPVESGAALSRPADSRTLMRCPPKRSRSIARPCA
jgi:hypothetical protein